MANVSMSHLTHMQKYWLVTGSVGPRPIALVTSMSQNGLCNAAPFSAFNHMGEDPPLFAIAVVHYGEESHRVGERKDTLCNIIERGEFVVNMVDEAIVERAVLCGSDFAAVQAFQCTRFLCVGISRVWRNCRDLLSRGFAGTIAMRSHGRISALWPT